MSPRLRSRRACAQRRLACCALAASSALLAGLPARAQSVPEAGTVLREVERAPRVLSPVLPREKPPAAPTERPPRPDDEVRFTVERFRLEGATLLPEADLQAALTPWRGREIGFSDLEDALQAVAVLYRSRGWLARPLLPVQDIVDGTVAIRVSEARLGEIRLAETPARRLSPERVVGAMTARQRPGEPLRLDALDRAMKILDQTPGVGVKAALAPSERVDGASDIVVELHDEPLLAGSVSLDDTGARSTGRARASANASLDSPLRIGDQLAATLMRSDGVRYARLSYALPAGDDGLRVGVNASALAYRLVGEFASLRARGSARSTGLVASYPLHKGAANNLNAALSLDDKRFDNEANGRSTSRKALRSVTATLAGDGSDGLAGGGFSLWNASLTGGRLDLGGDAANAVADRAGPRTAGGYVRLAGTVARLQQLPAHDTLWLSLSGQVASRNLDSSEKFSLGGPTGVRAYPVSEASGDAGWLATIEWRRQLNAQWQVSGFYDQGRIVANHDPGYLSAGSSPNAYGLRGAGAGLAWAPGDSVSLRLTLARRLGRNPAAQPDTGADNDGTRPRLRAWVSLVAAF